MKFRRSAPAALIVMGTVLIAGLTFLSSRLFDGMIQSEGG
jgi:hypothetical protein